MNPSSREFIVGLLRRLGLLSLYDRCKFFCTALAQGPANRKFRREHPDFPVPPPALAYDAYAHVRYREYRDSGRQHAQFIAGLINDHASDKFAEILEWGCGPARVIRHLPVFLRNPARLAGTDYNPRSVDWCRANIPGVEFEINQLAPPLPFADGRFDAAYVLSVFTHLSEAMHEAWRDELARALKPGGLLILTLHGARFRERHLDDGEKRAYDRGELVVRGRVAEGKKWFAAFHPPAYVRENLLRGFDVVLHQPSPLAAGFEQDVWVARKKG